MFFIILTYLLYENRYALSALFTLVLLVLIFLSYRSSSSSKEEFKPLVNEKAENLYNFFMNTDITYFDYLDYLADNKNDNTDLVDKKVFTNLMTKKSNNNLSRQDILKLYR